MPVTLYTFSSPPGVYGLSGLLVPWFWTVAIALTIVGLWMGFFVAPTDATQGEVYRIIYIHNSNISQALKVADIELPVTPEKELILNFILASDKGIIRGPV